MAKIHEIRTVIFDKNLNRIIKDDKIFKLLFKNIYTLTELNSFLAQNSMMDKDFLSKLVIKGVPHNLSYSYVDKEDTFEFNFFILSDDWSMINHAGCYDINDRLTGVLTEQNVISLLKHEIKRTIRDKDATTVLVIDIEHLKNINEMFGYLAGDYVLQNVSKVLQENTRGSDALGRYKGDKFIVALHKTDTYGTMQYIKKFETALKDTRFLFNEFDLEINVHFGVTLCEKDDQSCKLLERAEKALNKAKKGHESNVEFIL